MVYLITCRICYKQYVGSTTTPFRMRFNNYKSILIRFEKGQRGICGEHLYAHFFEEGHSGSKDLIEGFNYIYTVYIYIYIYIYIDR